jgi:putative transferase (TIGR04331 family)
MKFIHFSGLEKNINCSKKDNVILSWNLSNNYFKNYKKKQIFQVSEIWQKNKFKIKNKVFSLRKKILPQLCKELNYLNKINYSEKEWEILLEPWLNNYLLGAYFKWTITSKLISIYKKINFLEIKVKNTVPVFDTLEFIDLNHNNDIYNHLFFQDILKFKNIPSEKKVLKESFQIQNKLINKIYKKIKNNYLLLLYEIIINKLVNIKILINIRTTKINFLKICLKLNILPFKGLYLFDRRKIINILNKNSFDLIKRQKLSFKISKKNEFENFIFNKIKRDIPRIFIENFNDIKNLHKNKLERTDSVITDTMHWYNPIFKSWLAYKKNINKNFKIITAAHGGVYGGVPFYYDYNKSISTIEFKYQKKILKNQIRLPCLFLKKYNRNLNDKILLICTNVPKYPKHFLTGPLSDEINFNFFQVKKFTDNIEINKKKIFIRPYVDQTAWEQNKKYQQLLGLKNLIYSNNSYEKLKQNAGIKIVTYPQTAFLECVINGPTFLLFNPIHYNDISENEKFMKILFKNKIAFKDGKELAIHLNKVESHITLWWNQKKIQNSINLFIKNVNLFDNNATNSWAKKINQILKK